MKKPETPGASALLRATAETIFAHELEALAREDRHERPPGWRLSPRAVVTYLVGGAAGETLIEPKYMGPGARRIVEIAVATLATDRAVLLVGEPGTAKSLLSEHLAAAISGDSTKVVQGTAGATEEHFRYTWNYAILLTRGMVPEAVVPSPVYRAMEEGRMVRVEEITRCPSEVQDALITILSEKAIAVPDVDLLVQAQRGFNLIATANLRDRGVNEMSAALKRRFNLITLPVPTSLEAEVEIVERRVRSLGSQLSLPAQPPAAEVIRRVVQVFQELRRGQTTDGRQKVKSPSGVLSTAEAISVLGHGMAMAGHFGDGEVRDRDVAASVLGAVIKDDPRDAGVFVEYLENIARPRGGAWLSFSDACLELLRQVG
ncbi:MAG: AAA family ATPase [Deltaproteobacteria bacterium]|nr:AAA family ATPase [Deltaproteobacteria bacterium]